MTKKELTILIYSYTFMSIGISILNNGKLTILLSGLFLLYGAYYSFRYYLLLEKEKIKHDNRSI